MNHVQYSLLALLCISSFIYPTAKCLKVLKGTNNQLVFVVDVHHEMKNVPADRDDEMVKKMLLLLKQEEHKPGGGFRVLVESTAKGKGTFFMTPDLLSELMDHADEFTNSSIEDIEMREVAKAAGHIYDQISPKTVSQYFRGERSFEDDAEGIREGYQHYCSCDINLITFADLFDEYERKIKDMSDAFEGKSPEQRNELLFTIGNVRRNMRKLEQVLTSFAIQKSDGIIDAALELSKLPIYAGIARLVMRDALFNVSAQLFNGFLLKRLFTMLAGPAAKPIVIISASTHATYIVARLQRFSFKVVERILMHETPDKKKVLPLEPEALELLKKQAEDYPPVKTSWCSCIFC